MYLSVLFGTLALVTVALGGLGVATSLAAASERHAAMHYADIALEQARYALVAQIAAQVRAGAPDGPFVLPSPDPLEPLCVTPPAATAPPCVLAMRTSAVLLGQTGGGAAPNEVAENVQRAPGASENRLAAKISATVVTPFGVVIRSRTVLLRTYAAPPYASDDGSDEPNAGGVVSGDSGGTCDGSAACGGVDTRIHAKLVCSNPLDPARCSGMPDRYVDAFQNEDWANAHAVPGGWSP